jgi:hypothetical protein
MSTLPKDPHLSSTTILKEWFEIFANSINIYSKYWLSYMHAISEFTDSMNSKNYASPSAAGHHNPFTPYAFLYDFVDATNSELNKQLRSKDFLQTFKKYMEGMANLNCITNRIFH